MTQRSTALVRVPGIAPFEMEVHAKLDLHISAELRERGGWEPVQTHVFTTLLKSGDTVLDVGANIGYYTLLASKIVGLDGHVFAFEPEAENFALLERNCRLNDCSNTVCAQVGIAERAQTGRVYVDRRNLGNHKVFEAQGLTAAHEVPLIDLDSYCADRMDRVDMVKIDVEGAEFRVLCGMENLIATNREHIKLIVEYAPNHLRAAGHLDAVKDKLRNLFCKMMVIGEPNSLLAKIAPEYLDSFAAHALERNRGEFVNLLCFASEASFAAAREAFAR